MEQLFYTLEENELGAVEPNNKLCFHRDSIKSWNEDYSGEPEWNREAKKTKKETRQDYFDRLCKSKDVVTYVFVLNDMRIGYSKQKSLYFYYYPTSEYITFCDTAKDLLYWFHRSFNSPSVDSGCGCEDCSNDFLICKINEWNRKNDGDLPIFSIIELRKMIFRLIDSS
jgi:hypothetical protein